MPIPTLHTNRLILRPFAIEDAAVVQHLAGDREVASTTLTIPHPYEDGAAETWIEGRAAAWDARKILALAVTQEQEGVVGAISLKTNFAHRRGELGYWIGIPFWNRGYATEAAKALVDYGFDELGLNRIETHYLTRNPASGQVLAKVGMKHEGVLRQHIVKWDVAEDIGLYALLASER